MRPGHTGPRPHYRAFGLLLTLGICLLILPACNPVYVARAGWAQAQILASRVPLTKVMTDPATDSATRDKLRLVWDARHFAVEELGFRNAGDAYTSLAELRSDTLALVLSAAYQDRLAFRTWWFPIAGRVPYRAYFSLSAAQRARDALTAEGFDTWLRPTAAFSTLGWFADPLYSTLLRLDEVGLIETVLHELAHNHLYLPGHSRFNESWATFAGHAAAIEFFCRRDGGGPETQWCLRAQDRWADAVTVSRWIDRTEGDIRALYDRYQTEAREDAPESRAEGNGAGVGDGSKGSADGTTRDNLLLDRERIYLQAYREFTEEIQPSLRRGGYNYLGREPLNNATLLSRSLYFHRLPDFDTLLGSWGGDFGALMQWIREEAPGMADPFAILDHPDARGALPDPATP